MSVGNVTRIITVLVVVVAAAASATSSSNQPQSAEGSAGPGDTQNSPPPSQDMESSRALGLWKSTFGAVKIEPDASHGGLASGNIQGIWLYDRQGQEVVGYFSGNLRGNVLQFRWQEPNNPPLTGEGYLVFDVQGRQYSGRWWSDTHDRVGDWNGWRQAAAQGPRTSDPGQFGGQNGYGQRRSPYQQAPYAPNGQPQQPPDPNQQPPQPAPIRYN